MTTKSEKLAAIVAVILCSVSILTTLLVIPSLYDEVNRFSTEIIDEVNLFKVNFFF